MSPLSLFELEPVKGSWQVQCDVPDEQHAAGGASGRMHPQAPGCMLCRRGGSGRDGGKAEGGDWCAQEA